METQNLIYGEYDSIDLEDINLEDAFTNNSIKPSMGGDGLEYDDDDEQEEGDDLDLDDDILPGEPEVDEPDDDDLDIIDDDDLGLDDDDDDDEFL